MSIQGRQKFDLKKKYFWGYMGQNLKCRYFVSHEHIICTKQAYWPILVAMRPTVRPVGEMKKQKAQRKK